MLRYLLPAVLVALTSAAHGDGNLALDRPYTLAPEPNYALCKDPGDATQLTDGVFTEGYFWTQPTTVGWSDVRPVVITLDLGSDLPIGEVVFSTAARKEAGVLWPRAIFLRASQDGESWHDAGELVALATVQGTVAEPEAAPAGHLLRRYRATPMPGHGRYLALVVVPGGQYCFVDEIEVARGPEGHRAHNPATPALSRPDEGLDKALADTEVLQAILADAAAVGREIARAPLDEAAKAALRSELLEALGGTIEVPEPVYRETFPINEMHRRVLALGGKVALAAGRPELEVWAGQRWDRLQPRSAPDPDGPAPELRLTLMRGEVRSAVLNLTDNLPRRRSLTLRLEGLDAAAKAAVRVHSVAWTFSGTTPVAAALPVAERGGAGWEIDIPEGTTRQVWLMVDGRGAAPGSREGSVVLCEGPAEVGRVPLRLRVSPIEMPARLSLALGGWDYTDGPKLYHLSEPMRRSLVDFLREYDIDAPWATKQVMPFGEHAPDGTMTRPPATGSMDEWLEMWRGSRLYCVFTNFEGSDALGPGLPMDDANWGRAIGEWISFWVAHLQARDIAPQQLCLLLVDEPRNPELDALTIRYAEAIRAAEPDVVIWTDPIWEDPGDADPRLYELATVIAPQRPMWLQAPARYEEVFGRQQRAGRRLAFYSCSGPVRALDPYSYHLLQAWDCFRRGMDQEFFWSFGGGGGMAAWSQIGPENMVFTPQYRTPEGWLTSRHMEAIREGRYDYEYLVILQEAIAAAREVGCDPALIARAQALLESAPTAVLEAPGAAGVWWEDHKDRDVAEKTRLQVLRMIERLEARCRRSG